MTSDGVRQITDSRVLAAMSHPLRRRLMDMLRVYGPSTASTLAERTGQAVGNVSHHLRALGACDLIEEAPELARDRRERWWRLVSAGLSWSRADFDDDAAAQVVHDAARSLNLDHNVRMVTTWFAAGDDEVRSWGDNDFSADRWLHLTPDELAEVNEEIRAVLDRWSRREAPDDGQRRRPVFVFTYGVPGQP